MKKLIIGLVIGLTLGGLASYAQEKIIVNPFQGLGRCGWGEYYTTKVATPEGTYRIFSVINYSGAGITAIKID